MRFVGGEYVSRGRYDIMLLDAGLHDALCVALSHTWGFFLAHSTLSISICLDCGLISGACELFMDQAAAPR